MRTQIKMLHDLAILPYYCGVPIEVDPALVGGLGRYTEGTLRNHTFIELVMDAACIPDALTVGATYRAVGVDDDGNRLSTHWLFCTSTAPAPIFGVSINWRFRNAVAPLAGDPRNPWIRLEKLEDLTMTWASPPPSLGVSQNRIGQRGWLVMTPLTTPASIGFLIEDPTLPPAIAEGFRGIAISAKSSRTLQSIGFSALTCVDAGEPALFLEAMR
ncbi:hypothetical protein [Jannaschia marina]|uniref:hypothetical protein n=1 Tax=Jannaschia marina TaxID=2741674 RepID=UPI0015CDFF32|nr:hypothetical protein [Jannaschia marina]